MSRRQRRISYKAVYPNRTIFYTEVLKRLIDDVGPYVERVRTPHANNQYFGNFALIRMMMPVVEAVATAERRKPWDVLMDMSIPLPRLTWTMFRHALMHNDNPLIVEWGHHTVSWMISPFRHQHSINSDSKEVHIDCTQLYNDLCTYLESNVQKPTHRNALQRVRVQIINPKSDEKAEFDVFG